MSENEKYETSKIDELVDLYNEAIDNISNIEDEKTEEEKPIEAITLNEPEEKTGKGLGVVANGTIGSTIVKTPTKKKDSKVAVKKTEVEKVAIHSTRNVTWQGVGKVYNGYNIVTKEQADKWLTRNHVRLATPEEVAKEFGL